MHMAEIVKCVGGKTEKHQENQYQSYFKKAPSSLNMSRHIVWHLVDFVHPGKSPLIQSQNCLSPYIKCLLTKAEMPLDLLNSRTYHFLLNLFFKKKKGKLVSVRKALCDYVRMNECFMASWDGLQLLLLVFLKQLYFLQFPK